MPDDDRFAGTAPHYAAARPDYGEDVIDLVVEQFDLGDAARVLDLGCGTGQLAVALAPHARHVLGVDPNAAMLDAGRERAADAGVEVEWIQGSDEDLSGEWGPLRATVMGRSFHWMDQPRTLDRLRSVTERGGGVAIVDDTNWFTVGREPWQDAVYDLVGEYLDGLPERLHPEAIEYDDPWDELLADHGFDVTTATFDRRREWSVDEIVDYVFSLSYCSPERFGDDAPAFERDLRALLAGRDEEQFLQNATVEVIVGQL